MSKTDKNDEKALKLLELLKTKKEKVAKLSKPQYLTNMTFFYPMEGKNVNMHVCNEENKLFEYYAFISGTIIDRTNAKRDLLEDEEAEAMGYEGFTLEEWRTDFKTKLGVINIRKEKASLKVMEEKINSMISEEKRTELELELMEKELLN